MPTEPIEENHEGKFAFRIKIGEYEVEINGDHREVLKTIKELPNLMTDIYKALENSKPKTKTTLTVKKAATKKGTPVQEYPKISRVEDCSEAILNILETDWGKWRPHTFAELKEALKANRFEYPGRTLAGVLLGLVKKRRVRRWKTDAGYVYILAEKEAIA